MERGMPAAHAASADDVAVVAVAAQVAIWQKFSVAAVAAAVVAAAEFGAGFAEN